MIRKSYVVKRFGNFGNILRQIFKASNMSFWGKLNLQIFRYTLDAKIVRKIFWRAPRARTSTSKPMKLSDILRKSQICIKFVVFYRSHIKNEIWIFQEIPRTPVEYLARARTHSSKWGAEISLLCSFLKNSKFCRVINFYRTEMLNIWKSIYIW